MSQSRNASGSHVYVDFKDPAALRQVMRASSHWQRHLQTHWQVLVNSQAQVVVHAASDGVVKEGAVTATQALADACSGATTPPPPPLLS